MSSGVSLSLVLGFSAAYAYYYFNFIAKKAQLIAESSKFSRFLKVRCPVVSERYCPPFWCWESRMQTLLRPLLSRKPRLCYRNELIRAADGGQISLDWIDSEDSSTYPDSSTRPIVLLMPGLTGSSEEIYIMQTAKSTQDLGYRCVIFNYRGNAGEKLLTPRTYCAANIEDIMSVLEHITMTYSSAPLIAAGFSMGGMLLINYLGRVGKKTPLLGGMVFSAGWDVFKSTVSLETPLNYLLFNSYLAKCLKGPVNRERDVFENIIDINYVMKARTIREFDERFTSVIFGYETNDDYYRDASPCHRIKSVQIPVLCLNAADDIFSPAHAFPVEQMKENPNVAFMVTSHGGHIGFLDGLWPCQGSYMDRVFRQFSNALIKEGQHLQDL